MKSILEVFPRASKDTIALNPQSSPTDTPKNSVQPVLKRKRGKIHNNETPNRSEIPDSKSQHHKTAALGSANEGKAKGVVPARVRFTGFRVRPLDPDNFAASVKDLLDGLRHAQILQGDEPWRIIFETAQEKVKTYAEERTVIEIETPPVSL